MTVNRFFGRVLAVRRAKPFDREKIGYQNFRARACRKNGTTNLSVSNHFEDFGRGRGYLELLAESTGGKMFRAESTIGGLNAAFEGIAKELRGRYSIGYYPAEAGDPGQRKQIKVRVNRSNVAVRARDSYIVGANDSSPKK
jgi:VWFA-related protein